MQEVPEALNKLAREQMKRKLLADILQDITVCSIEGWDYRGYIEDLISMLRRLID